MLIKVAGTCPGLELLYCKDKEVRLMSQERERQDRGTPPHPFSTTFSMRDIPERVVAISFFQTEYMYCLNLTKKMTKRFAIFLRKTVRPNARPPPMFVVCLTFFLKGIL